MNPEGGWSGEGSDFFDTDPMFVDEAGGNLRLLTASPCINAGDDEAVSAATDLDGNQRIFDGQVDLGAYESQDAVEPACTGDVDGNATVDLDDLVTVLGAWGVCDGCSADLDGDGVVDFADLIQVLWHWGPCP